MKNRLLLLIPTIITALLVVACGGGGGDSSLVGGGSPSTLSGTVASGAPMDSGTVTAYDATGKIVGSGTVNSDGTYSIAFDTAKYIAPYTIKAEGEMGSGAITMYALVGSGGIANVTPISNAIAANLASGGDPSTLISGHSVTAFQISALDVAMTNIISPLTTALGASGSISTSTYTASWDKVLDNLVVNTSPSGTTTISTSLNQIADNDSSTSNSTAVLKISAGSPASGVIANNSASTNSISASNLISVSDLNWLQNQLTACFANPANINQPGVGYSGGGRLTANSTTPISPCVYSNFTNNTSALGTSFKHSGYYWIDPHFFANGTSYNGRNIAGNNICGVSGGASMAVTNNNWNNPLCRGYFGHMLTSPSYDNATFLTPQIIRPATNDGSKWVVKFPIKFSDGSRDYLGTNIGIESIIIQKTATPNIATGDTGWRFVGDQRDFAVQAQSNVLKSINVLNTNYVRWTSSLNFYMNGGLSETDQTHFIKSAVVTGPGLPAGGINYLNILNNGSDSLTTPISNTNPNPKYSACGNLFGGAYLQIALPAFNTNGNTVQPPCTSLYKLTWTASQAAYDVDCSKPIGQSSYASCNTATNHANVPDSTIATAFDGYVGHPYTITLTLGKLSDGSTDTTPAGTITYVSRLTSPPLKNSEMKASSLNYVNLLPPAAQTFAAFHGAGNLNIAWTPFLSPRLYKAQLLWGQAAGILNYGFTQSIIDAGSFTINCNSSGNTDNAACTSSSYYNGTGLPSDNTSGGSLNLWSRFPTGLNVGTSLIQY